MKIFIAHETRWGSIQPLSPPLSACVRALVRAPCSWQSSNIVKCCGWGDHNIFYDRYSAEATACIFKWIKCSSFLIDSGPGIEWILLIKDISICDNIMQHATTAISSRMKAKLTSVPSSPVSITDDVCAPTQWTFASSDCIRNHSARMWQSMGWMELNGTLYPALIDSTLQSSGLNYIPCSNRFVARRYLLAAAYGAIRNVWATTPTKTINITINVLLRQHQFAHVVSFTGLALLWILPTNHIASHPFSWRMTFDFIAFANEIQLNACPVPTIYAVSKFKSRILREFSIIRRYALNAISWRYFRSCGVRPSNSRFRFIVLYSVVDTVHYIFHIVYGNRRAAALQKFQSYNPSTSTMEMTVRP